MFAGMNEVLEAAGFITGVAGVWLTTRRHIYCFPVGIANVLISSWLFFGQKLYADVLQQVAYIVLLAYGWFRWQNTRAEQLETAPAFLNKRERFRVISAIASLTVVLGSLLKYFTDAVMPWADSFATSTAFAAQFLIARRKTDNWILWIVVNCCYIVIYLERSLPLYAVLSTIYLILAIAGLRAWMRSSGSSLAAR